MDEKSSWTRIAITVVLDWRFVLAVVTLVLVLLPREQTTFREGRTLPEALSFYAQHRQPSQIPYRTPVASRVVVARRRCATRRGGATGR